MKRIFALILTFALCLSTVSAVGAAAPDASGTAYIQKSYVRNFIKAARTTYRRSDYADYTTSIIDQKDNKGNYLFRKGYYDQFDAVKLTWNKLAATGDYTLFVSAESDFPNDGRTAVYENIMSASYELTNLESATTYYWKATRGTKSTPVSSFTTDDFVRFLTVDGIANVRDIGGWNGLNQSLAYRGTEMNGSKEWSGHNYILSDAGRETMRSVMKIKTDLDLRSEGKDSNYITESPIGSDVRYVITGLTAYTGAFDAPDAYRRSLELFADIDNYPIYFHCWGGADRTGTLACLIEALCGATEQDLSIDFELTSFSSAGFRYRYDEGGHKFASFFKRLKNYPGDTLSEKTANYMRATVGLTEAQISNIRSIMGGNGVSFDTVDDLIAGQTNEVRLRDLGEREIVSVTQNGVGISWSLSGDVLSVCPQTEENGRIVFEDGTALTFGVFAPLAELARNTDRMIYDAVYPQSGAEEEIPLTCSVGALCQPYLIRITADGAPFGVSLDRDSQPLAAVKREDTALTFGAISADLAQDASAELTLAVNPAAGSVDCWLNGAVVGRQTLSALPDRLRLDGAVRSCRIVTMIDDAPIRFTPIVSADQVFGNGFTRQGGKLCFGAEGGTALIRFCEDHSFVNGKILFSYDSDASVSASLLVEGGESVPIAGTTALPVRSVTVFCDPDADCLRMWVNGSEMYRNDAWQGDGICGLQVSASEASAVGGIALCRAVHTSAVAFDPDGEGVYAVTGSDTTARLYFASYEDQSMTSVSGTTTEFAARVMRRFPVPPLSGRVSAFLWSGNSAVTPLCGQDTFFTE